MRETERDFQLIVRVCFVLLACGCSLFIVFVRRACGVPCMRARVCRPSPFVVVPGGDEEKVEHTTRTTVVGKL